MKIKLVAFYGAWEMQGSVVVPDNTENELKISLPTPINAEYGKSTTEEDMLFKELYCIFTFMGFYSTDGERIYRLTDVRGN